MIKYILIKFISIVLSFTFLLTLLSILIVRFNINGRDDKNILLYFTSPPFWVLEDYSVTLNVIYISTIIFWFVIGIFLDFTVTKRIHKFFQENF